MVPECTHPSYHDNTQRGINELLVKRLSEAMELRNIVLHILTNVAYSPIVGGGE